VDKVQSDLTALRKSLQPFEAAARDARDAVASLRERADELTKELAGGMTRLGAIEEEKLQAETSLAALRTKRTEAEEAVARKEVEIAGLKNKASQVGERPAVITKMTAEELQRDIEQKSARARAEADGKLSPKEIVEQYEGAMAKFDLVTASLNSLDQLAQQLTRMAEARQEYYHKLRRNYAHRLSLYFMKYISQRGYSGGLSFEHDDAKLAIDVDVEAHQSAEARRSVHTLSGGERMFSTLSFLLSLWMTNESPFYALDEFDVFMDALHRTQSLKLLSEHARLEGLDRQFILISPQSEEGMPKGADVRSFRLGVPERGLNQGVLE
jgi:chromosome segregation ATPase